MRPRIIRPPTFDPEVFERAWYQLVPAAKSGTLHRLTPEKIRILSPMAPRLLEREASPTISTLLIRTFFRLWPMDQLRPLTDRMGAKQFFLRLAALEALIHLSPDSLRNSLPAFLRARDPRFKILAIRGLWRLDRSECLDHLENMILHGTSTDKTAGFQCLVLLPFENIRGLLLKVLAMESDSKHLERAGLLFQANPDAEVPFKLLEIADTSPPEKSEIIKAILEKALKGIEKSGILNEGFREYQIRLRSWMDHRHAIRLLREGIARFATEGSFEKDDFEAFCSQNLALPGFKDVIKEAISWPIPEEVRASLRELFSPLKQGVPVVPEGEPSEEALPEEKQECAAILNEIRRGDGRRRALAFNQLSRRFPAKALELALKLFERTDLESHENALKGVSFIDFSLTRDILTDFLARNPTTPLFRKIMLLFQNNPEFENLYNLFKIEKFVSGLDLELVRETRNKIQGFLIQYQRLKPDFVPELEKEFQGMWEQEKAREAQLLECSPETLRKK